MESLVLSLHEVLYSCAKLICWNRGIFESLRHLNTHQSNLISRSAGLTNQSKYSSSLIVTFVCYQFGIGSKIEYAFISQIIHAAECLRNTYKKHFVLSKCKSVDEIDQDTEASAAIAV